MRSRFLTYFVLLAVLIIAGCRAGIDPRQSGALTITFSGNGSGTEDDPLRIVKSSEVTFGATDADGNPVEVTWSVAGISASESVIARGVSDEAIPCDQVNSGDCFVDNPGGLSPRNDIQFSTSSNCGSFSGDTYTAPSGINGSGMCIITGTADADLTASGSAYVRIMVGDNLSYTTYPVYEASASAWITSGAVVASMGDLNFVLAQGPGQGIWLGSSTTASINTATSAKAFSIEDLVFEVLFSDVTGLPMPTPESDDQWPRLYIDSNGTCYAAWIIGFEYPALFVSSDCQNWDGPYLMMDTFPERIYETAATGVGIAVDGEGVVHAVWGDQRFRSDDNLDVVYNKCEATASGSYICGADICLTCDEADSEGVSDPEILVYGSGATARINIFWHNHHDTVTVNGEVERVMMARSTDGGATFRGIEQISDGHGQWPSAVLGDDGTIYLTYDGYSGFQSRIYYTESGDGGESFTPRTPISSDTLSYYKPDIALFNNGGVIIVARQGSPNSAGYFLSTTGGETWSGFSVALPSAADIGGGTGRPISVASSGNKLYVAWISADDDINYAVSTNSGSTWSASAITVNDSSGSIRTDFSGRLVDMVAAPDGNVYMVWTDSRNVTSDPNVDDIYMSVCTATSCSANRVAATSARDAPYLFSTGRNSNGDSTYGMLMADGRSGVSYDIYYCSGIFGQNPTSDDCARVDDDTTDANQLLPAGVVDSDGAIHTIWLDSRGASQGKNHLYYSKSTDNGATWGGSRKLNNNEFSQMMTLPLPPAIAARGDNIYVAWSDDSDADQQYATDLYYREYIDGQWSDIVNITPNTAMILDGLPSITIGSDGTVYLIYLATEFADFGGGEGDEDGGTVISVGVYFTSKATGGSFRTPVKIADGMVAGSNNIFTYYPKIVIDADDRLTAAWVNAAYVYTKGVAVDNGGIYWMRSADGGTTWRTPELLTSAPAAGVGEAAAINHITADENGRVYILYTYGTGTANSLVPTSAYLAVGE